MPDSRMSDPVNTSALYPLLGLLHLVTHPKTLTAPIRASADPTHTLLPTIIKTFLLTSTLTGVLILTLYRLTDHVLYLVTKSLPNIPIFPLIARNSWLRTGLAILGVAIQAALIAGRVVEYVIGEGARRVGGGVLMAEIGTQGIGNSLADMATSTTASTTEGLKSTLVATTTSNPKDTIQNLEKKLEKTVQQKSLLWVVKKAVTIPIAAAVPLVGPVVYAVVNSTDLGRQYVQGYAKMVGMERVLEENRRSVKAFGLVAGILQAIPFVGPVFYFSNYVGSALWVADMKKTHKDKEPSKLG